jgi:hypothetical protein
MLSCDTEIYNFQNYLLGETRKFLFKPADISDEEKKKQTLKIVKWIIDDVLCWTPQDALEHFGEKEIATFKLKTLLDNFFSNEGMGRRNYAYMLSLIYPKDINTFLLPSLSLTAPINNVVMVAVAALAMTIQVMKS